MRTANLQDYDLYHNLQDSDYARNFQGLVMQEFPAKHHSTVVDFGCGRGHAVKRFVDAGYDAIGVDASNTALSYGVSIGLDPDRLKFIDPFLNLPFPEHFADIVFSADVMEHLEEHTIPFVLGELARICRKVLVMSICFRPATTLAETGIQWHSTIQPRKWWEEAIARNCPSLTKVEGWEAPREPNLFVYRRA